MNNTSLDALFSGLTKNEPTEKQETPPQPEPPVIKKSVEQGTAREKYNPQIEMFARFKMKSSFHKTKRII